MFTDFCTLKFNANLNPNGVGLGLSICKKICNNLNGDITLVSKIGVGTKFTFNVSADLVTVKERQVEAKSSGLYINSGGGLIESMSELSPVANKMQLMFKQFNSIDESKSIEMVFGPSTHTSKDFFSNSRILVVDDQIFNIEFMRC